MRRLVLKMQMSLDGFVGKPDGDVSWIFNSFDDALTAWILDTVWNTDLHIMGAHVYRDMAAHWPASKEPFAAPMNKIPKAVFSKSLKEAEATWDTTEIIRGDLATEIDRLKAMPGKDLLAHGGAGFVRSLIRLGLIDEYRMVVHPNLLGVGLPIFSELPKPLDLKLIESRSFPKGAVVSVYRPA